MWMELKRLKKNKSWGLCLALLWIVPFAAAADEPDKTPHYWVKIAGKYDSLPGVQKLVGDLPDEIRKDSLRVCMDGNKYVLVHTGAADPDAAYLIKEKLSQHLNKKIKTDLVQYDPAQCFSIGHFLKKRSSKTHSKVLLPPKPEQNPVTSDASVHIYPDITRYNAVDSKETGATDQAAVLPKSMVKILPEVSTQVYLSNLDINRVTCMGDRLVKDVIFSAEKGITTKINGGNAFIKLQMHQNTPDNKPKVVDEPVELYVVCGNEGDVYTIIGIPKKIPAQWVQLISKQGSIKKNLSLFDGKDFENKIVTIIRQAWTEDYPDSYTIKKPAKPVAATGMKWLNVTLHRIVDIQGEGFRVKEYILTLSSTAGEDERRILEKDFLLPEFSGNPLAVTLDSLVVKKDFPTRLFIVERSDSDPQIGINRSAVK